MSGAERQARYLAKLKIDAKPVILKYRRPRDRRSRAKQWEDAAAVLTDILEFCQDWRDRLPKGLVNSPLGDRLDEMIAVRDAVERIATVSPPQGFGRD